MKNYDIKDFIEDIFSIKKSIRVLPEIPIVNNLGIPRRLHELELNTLSLAKAINKDATKDEIQKLADKVTGNLLILQSLSIIGDTELDTLLDKLALATKT